MSGRPSRLSYRRVGSDRPWLADQLESLWIDLGDEYIVVGAVVVVLAG